jgi:hypothetical protein
MGAALIGLRFYVTIELQEKLLYVIFLNLQHTCLGCLLGRNDGLWKYTGLEAGKIQIAFRCQKTYRIQDNKSSKFRT